MCLCRALYLRAQSQAMSAVLPADVWGHGGPGMGSWEGHLPIRGRTRVRQSPRPPAEREAEGQKLQIYSNY